MREYIATERARIKQRLDDGVDGLSISHALCDLVDDVVLQLRLSRLEKLSEDDRQAVENNLAYVALAGYARRDVAPFSDVDLLLLKSDGAPAVVEQFAKQVVRDIWDAGFKLGHTVATASEFLKLARTETITGTSLFDYRHLCGPTAATRALVNRFKNTLRSGQTKWCKRILNAIQEEQDKFGSTVHLLEPDLKRSKGGLRDIHLLRWLGQLLHGTSDPLELERAGVLGTGDAQQIRESHDFLLRVRAHLHFHAGAGNDSLSRSEQVRLAAIWGYTGTASLLAVEQFMREYFRHTTAIADITDRFVEGVRPQGVVQGVGQMVMSRRVGKGIWISGQKLIANEQARQKFADSLQATTELMNLAAAHECDLDRPIVEALRQAYGNGNGSREIDHELLTLPVQTARSFMTFLGKTGKLLRLLRVLHHAGVLKHFLPEFEHARCLLQFNAYHKYTVDEHTFVMLGHAEQLQWSDDLLGQEYRRIARKDLLHLAILLHDLGKGFDEDHSEVGKRLAQNVAERFHLPDEDRECLVFLVHRHLYLSQMAYHRDTSDPELWVQVSRTVGCARMLRMLYVLTAVDTMAVGPGTFNRWKSDLLNELYLNTIKLFGEADLAEERQLQSEKLRMQIIRQNQQHPRIEEFVASLPGYYLMEYSTEEIATHFSHWASRQRNDVEVWSDYKPETKTVCYTVMTHERVTEGIFHKICGGLAAHHLKVLSARIHTLADGTVIDQFEVQDPHHAGPPLQDRVTRVAQTIRRILHGELSVSDALWSSRSSMFLPKQTRFVRSTPRVVVDSTCSDNFTVIDVFTGDHRGLLYTLAKGIYRLGLSVEYAKIATYADEGVDVFYVKEADGKKVHRADRVAMIENHLLRDIESLNKDPRSMGF